MTTDIPTLSTAEDARTMLDTLAADHEWVSVFWDRGWGDSGQVAEISVIVDGDGQQPKAWITFDVYRALLDRKVIGENTLMTYKKRKLHDFTTPPQETPVGPNPTEVAEQAVRRFMDDHPHLPIVAEFYRGLKRGPHGPQVEHEVVGTPAAGSGWFVLVLPGCAELAVSAQKPDHFGHAIIGGGVADTFGYPKTGDGEVDVDALSGERFRSELASVLEDKARMVAAARAEG